MNLKPLKAAETLPSQIGAFHAFARDRQKSERFPAALRKHLQPHGEGWGRMLWRLLWSHSRGQTPTSVLSEALQHPPAPRRVTPIPRFPVPGRMLWNWSSQRCHGSEQHPSPSGTAGEPCQLTSLQKPLSNLLARQAFAWSPLQ